MENEIAHGTIDGMSEFSGFGERDHVEISTIGTDLWGGIATSIPWPNQLG